MSNHLVLDWLKVERFRYLAEPVELDFTDGHTVLVGLNGTGKTSLLLLIDAIAKLDFSYFSDDPGGLKVSFRLRFGKATLELSIDAHKDQTDTREYRFQGALRYEGQSDQEFNSQSGDFRSIVSPLVRSFAYGLMTTLVSLDTATDADHLIMALEKSRLQEPPRLDEELGIFRLLTENDGLRFTLREPRVYNPKSRVEHPETWVPGSVQSALWKVPKERRREPFTTDFLAIAARAAGFDKIEIELGSPDERTILQPEGWVERTYGPFEFYATKGASRFHHRGFSFGQKRIVAACWHAAAVGAYGILVADELVNGLHHSAIAEVLQLIGRRQAFFASQNPLLLDLLEFDDKGSLQKRIVSCKDSDAGWLWSQPSDGEADRLHEAYTAGFQHVSELLRDEGLW